MSRSHVSNTTLSLGSTGEPATPQGKKMVWNRRRQEWMVVDEAAQTPGTAVSPTANLLSSNAYASGVNQNSGNFLTEKPITRIHAPPGGVSSISFGDEHTAVPAAAAAKAKPGLVLGTPTQPATPESAESTAAAAEEGGLVPIPMMELPPAPSAQEGEEEEEEKEEEAAAAEAAVLPPPAPVSSNVYATGSNQNSGNFMTGRPTTRVRAPPGGASSITFG